MEDLILNFLLADTDLLASPCYNRQYIDTWMPKGYKRSNGACLVIRPIGGAGVDNFVIESQQYECRAFAPPIESNKNRASDALEIGKQLHVALEKATYPDTGLQFYVRAISSPDLTREEGGWFVVTLIYEFHRVIC